MSSANYNTSTLVILNIGSVSDSFDMTTLVDTSDSTPDAFSFIDQNGLAVNAQVESNSITVSGINVASPISISGGEYSVNGGSYTSVSATVNNGDHVSVRLTSSANYNTSTQATLNIGGVSDAFFVTTEDYPLDTVPDASSFVDQNDVELSSVQISNNFIVSGFDCRWRVCY